MNWPNILTMSRFGFAGGIAILLLQNAPVANVAALILFLLAALTDFYDGHLAKRKGLISDFGKIMDPLADKALILTVFGVLMGVGMVQPWMFWIIAAREIGVTADRLVLIRWGKVVPAEQAGKIKTVCQMTTIVVILLYLIFESAVNFYYIQSSWQSLINGLMVVTVFVTVGSGVAYLNHKWEKA